MLWIIGGTSEAVDFVNKIKGKIEYVVSVATDAGKEMLKDANVVISRLDASAMVDFIREHHIHLVADLSHPYAFEVTENAKAACSECQIRYLRYSREKTPMEGAKCFPSVSACAEFLKNVSGCVFFTTGTKNIKDFEQVKGNNRFVYRVLPAPFSLEECHRYHIGMRDIVALVGPASTQLNTAMFREYGAHYVVMKDSGDKGGTGEKLAACRELGITPLVLEREEEEGMDSLEKLLEMVLCYS